MAEVAAVVGVVSAAVGAGTSIFGSIEKSQAQKAELATQQQENAQREALFQLENQRKRIQALRDAQQASSLARVNATAQGAQFGSGLLGGLSQIKGEADYNLLGIKQNAQIGENLFSLDQTLTQERIQEANATGLISTGSALTSFGGMLVNNLGPINNLTSGIKDPYSSFFNNPTKQGTLY